jgi:hypothetical protein
VDRRNFFRLLGAGAAGLALQQAIPFGRVWSFPSQLVLPTEFLLGPAESVRFIRAYDPTRAAMISRLDVLCVFGELRPPQAVEHFIAVSNPSDRPIRVPLSQVPRPLLEAIKRTDHPRTRGSIFGAHMLDTDFSRLAYSL